MHKVSGQGSADHVFTPAFRLCTPLSTQPKLNAVMQPKKWETELMAFQSNMHGNLETAVSQHPASDIAVDRFYLPTR